MDHYILLWPDSHHTPTTIDLATTDQLKEIGGFPDETGINAAAREQGVKWIGQPFTVYHESGAGVTFIKVLPDRICITERLRDGGSNSGITMIENGKYYVIKKTRMLCRINDSQAEAGEPLTGGMAFADFYQHCVNTVACRGKTDTLLEIQFNELSSNKSQLIRLCIDTEGLKPYNPLKH